MYIENGDQKMNFYMTLMRLKSEFLFTDLSQNFGIYSHLYKSFDCIMKANSQKSYNHNPKIKA